MTLGLMQPYFLPYIGYFQLIHAVDVFVVYDDIKYTKRGWINRNRFLDRGKPEYFSIPLRKDSDFLHVRDRELAESFPDLRHKTLRRLEAAYRKAPHFEVGFDLVRRCYNYDDSNLFRFIRNSIEVVCNSLGIETPVVTSSTLQNAGPDLKAAERVLAVCRAVGASQYVNPIGGVELYDRDYFADQGVELRFIRTKGFEYAQFDHPFVPNLSIIDVVMFNGLERTRELLDAFDLIEAPVTAVSTGSE